MSALAMTIPHLLSDNLPGNADKIALIDRDESVTYGALAVEVDKVAAHLLQAGVMPGDRVIVHLRKSIAEVVAMFAVAKVGAVVVNVNAQWSLKQLLYVAADCGARFIIAGARAAAALAATAIPDATVGILVAGAAPDGPGFASWDALDSAGPVTDVLRLDSELAMIMYTSGSTGKPKGVMLSHRNILTGARSVARYLGLGSDDRLLSVLPYSFDYGLNQLTTMFLLGGTVVHQAVPMTAEIIETAVREKVTGIAAVPPLWAQIVRYLDANPVSLPALRRITNSGGKIPPNVLDRMPHVFPGVRIFLMYGLTEAFRSTFLAPEKFAAKAGSIGRAIPGAEIYVVRPGIGLAEPGEEGELVHRGPLVSLGYWGKPEATAEKVRPCAELAHLIGDEPVVWSGDTVRLDADGDIWFVGRADAMIKTSGFRLSPDEVEDLLCRSGLVGDVVAFGVDDDDMGQVVHVAISPLDGFEEAALQRHCRSVMPHYMIPRRFHVWEEPMPRTASGKLARPEITALCRSWLATEAERPATAAE